MSNKSNRLEEQITELGKANIGKSIPDVIPDWMINEGILAGSIIERSERIGQKNSKTDVFIGLKGDSLPIKISAKLKNADYFGNWYGHERLVKEFGIETFELLSKKATEWANKWMLNPSAELFVGVSVSFGARTGETCEDFTNIFKAKDMLKIVRGVKENDDSANALFVNDKCPSSVSRLISYLQEINEKNIEKAVKKFKVIYRPVNPEKNKTNRGKCIYTMFEPYKRQDNMIEVTSMKQLRKLGKFVPIEWNKSYKMNHNRLLDILRDCYNISIKRKE